MAKATKRADGRYQLGFRIDGKQYNVCGKTAKECEEKKRALLNKAEKGLALNKGRISLHDYYDVWKSRRITTGQVKKATVYANDRRFARIDAELGGKGLSAIKQNDVYMLQAALREDLTSKGVNDTISLLKSIMKSAVNERIIPYNPADGIKAVKRTEEEAAKNTHRFLSPDEVRTFFQYAKGGIYYNVFLFLLMTGMRCGEAGALTWGDIDEENRVIHITKTVTRISNKEYEIGTTKTQDSKRNIELTDEIKAILAEQRVQQAGLFGIRAAMDSEQIFTTMSGGLITQSNLSPTIAHICKKATAAGQKIERFTPHAFRHTFITHELEKGIPMNDIAAQVGHSNTITLQKYYSHEDPEKVREAFQMMSRDMMKIVNIS